MSNIHSRYFDQIAMEVPEKTVVYEEKLDMENEEFLTFAKSLEVTEAEAKCFLKEWKDNEHKRVLHFRAVYERFKESLRKFDGLDKLINGREDDQNADEAWYLMDDADRFVRFILDGDTDCAEIEDLKKLEEIIQKGVTALEDSRNDILIEVSFLKKTTDVPKRFDYVMSQADTILNGLKKILVQQKMLLRRYELYIESFRNAVMTSSFVKGCDRSEQERNIKKRARFLADLFVLGIDDFSNLDQWRAFVVDNKTLENSWYRLIEEHMKLFKFLYKYIEFPLGYEFITILLRLTVSTEIPVEIQGKLMARLCELRNWIKIFPEYIKAFDEFCGCLSELTDCLSESIRGEYKLSTIIKFWKRYQFGKKQGKLSVDLKFPVVVKKAQTDQRCYGVAFDFATASSFEKGVLDWGVHWHEMRKKYMPA